MFERFFPDEYVVSTYVIPFERLYEEGYRGVIFDIDNTLVPHVHRQMTEQKTVSEIERDWIFLLSHF